MNTSPDISGSIEEVKLKLGNQPGKIEYNIITVITIKIDRKHEYYTITMKFALC